jgi:hypothetical protein
MRFNGLRLRHSPARKLLAAIKQPKAFFRTNVPEIITFLAQSVALAQLG